MITLAAVIARFPDLEIVELSAWIDRGWVRPDPAVTPEWVFDDIDLARIDLIYDLRRRLDVAVDAVPMVLSLLDQVYGLRATLKAMTSAIEHQPAEVRAAIGAALARTDVP